ncbi:MAG: hypothetical protein QXS76_01405 [Candidatus Bathyarchaeia archaeon]
MNSSKVILPNSTRIQSGLLGFDAVQLSSTLTCSVTSPERPSPPSSVEGQRLVLNSNALETLLNLLILSEELSPSSWEGPKTTLKSVEELALWTNEMVIPQKDLLNHMLLDVSATFCRVPEVRAIYFQQYMGEIQFFVLLSIDRYDSQLMDRLIELEYGIRLKYSQTVFEFFYPPAGSSPDRDFIHPAARCIFMRNGRS